MEVAKSNNWVNKILPFSLLISLNNLFLIIALFFCLVLKLIMCCCFVLGRPKRNQTPDNESMDADLITTLPCACENVYLPVCGSDAKTYPNPCVARWVEEMHHSGAYKYSVCKTEFALCSPSTWHTFSPIRELGFGIQGRNQKKSRQQTENNIVWSKCCSSVCFILKHFHEFFVLIVHYFANKKKKNWNKGPLWKENPKLRPSVLV